MNREIADLAVLVVLAVGVSPLGLVRQSMAQEESKAASAPDLQGEWVVVEGEEQGMRLKMGGNLTFAIKGDKWSLTSEEYKIHQTGTFKADTTRKPETIDLYLQGEAKAWGI